MSNKKYRIEREFQCCRDHIEIVDRILNIYIDHALKREYTTHADIGKVD